MKNQKPNLLSRIYKGYEFKLFPYLEDFRGSTKIANLIARLPLSTLPQAKEVTKISELEFDNLIVLDGCRHDMYEEVRGSTESRYSAGSTSSFVIEENFVDEDWSDTVLIAGNPFFHESRFTKLTGKTPEDVFHEVFTTYDHGWSDKEGTVMPEPVVKDALTANKLFPDKKLLIWFYQPHQPFIGQDLAEGFENHLGESDVTTVWAEIMKGNIDHDRVKEGYRQNLSLVLNHVDELVNSLDGRIVITSDHGEMLGELGLYGHGFPDTRAKPLRKVPLETF